MKMTDRCSTDPLESETQAGWWSWSTLFLPDPSAFLFFIPSLDWWSGYEFVCVCFCSDRSHKHTRSVYSARSRTQERKETERKQTKRKYRRRNRTCSKLHRRISTMNDSMFRDEMSRGAKGACTEARNTPAISRGDKYIYTYGYIEKRRKMPLYVCV